LKVSAGLSSGILGKPAPNRARSKWQAYEK